LFQFGTARTWDQDHPLAYSQAFDAWPQFDHFPYRLVTQTNRTLSFSLPRERGASK
jgi:hypothetical protein